MDTQKLSDILDKGIREEGYSCFSAVIGRGDVIIFSHWGGLRARFPRPLPFTKDTLFDMASLSKLMGTTMSALRLIDKGMLSLDDTLGKFFNDCCGKEDITVRHLMTHTSGIPAYFRMYDMDITPDKAAETILAYPLAAPTGEKVIYTCMGYILLGKILERICSRPLDEIAREEVFLPLGMKNTCYRPSSDKDFAATEKDTKTGEYVSGKVHDGNARFLGGVSGNAGVFSDTADMTRFAQMLSRRGKDFISSKLFDLAITDHTRHCPTDPRGLGFQLFREGVFPGGANMSVGSYGHTGFTGTALYVDRETSLYCLLLTNRVHFGRESNKYFDIKREFFDTVFAKKI